MRNATRIKRIRPLKNNDSIDKTEKLVHGSVAAIFRDVKDKQRKKVERSVLVSSDRGSN